MSKLFVVLGETGEYSERNVFVCGVFTERRAAMQHMVDAGVRYRTYQTWYDGVAKIYNARYTDLQDGYLVAFKDGGEFVSITDIPEYNDPNAPPFERAERTTLFEVESDAWSPRGVDEVEEMDNEDRSINLSAHYGGVLVMTEK